MCNFCGKASLYDHMMTEKMYNKGSYYDSDEFECFKLFKERTNGTIYKQVKIKLTPYNIRQEAKKDPFLKITDHTEILNDRRYKDGKKEKKWFTVNYLGKEYKENELDKIDYWTKVAIKFDTILDLIPYYPYIIAVAAKSPKGEYILLSSESYVDAREKELLEYGGNLDIITYYRKELQNHYIEVVERLKGDK